MPKNSPAVATHVEASLTQTKEIVHTFLQMDPSAPRNARLAPFLHGEPGNGKTSISVQAAKECGFEKALIVYAAGFREEHLNGPPFPTDRGYSINVPPHAFYQFTKEAEDKRKQEQGDAYKPMGKVLIILDEFTRAHPSGQTVFMRMIEEGRFGVDGHELLDQVYIMGAGNAEADDAHVYEMDTPTRTRFAPHIKVKPTIEEWVEWARGAGVDPTIIAFVPQHPELILSNYNPNANALTYGNTRTWTKLSELLKAMPADRDDLRNIVAQGTIGPGAAMEYLAFERTARKAPTIEEILNDPQGAPIHTQDPDIAMVVTENIIHHANRQPKTIAKLLEYVNRMHAQYQDLLVGQLLNIQSKAMTQETVVETLVAAQSGGAVGDMIRKSSTRVARVVNEAENSQSRLL
jgi:hypothetical protein